MRYLGRLKYSGSHFSGWQIQPNSSTVKEIIEQKLSMLLSSEIKVIGCGRTDTGLFIIKFMLMLPDLNERTDI